MEKIIVANLRKALEKPRTKRGRVAVRMLRELAARHSKKSVSDVKLDGELIQQLFEHGGNSPLRKIRMKIVTDEKGGVLVLSPEKKVEKPKKEAKVPKAKPAKKEEAKAEKETEGSEQKKPKFEQKAMGGPEQKKPKFEQKAMDNSTK